MPRWLGALVWTLAAVACSSNSATLTSPTPDKCQLSVALETATIAPGGGDGRLNITTTPECTWTASTQAPWITGITPASGQGSGQVQFSVAPNSAPAAREADIVVNDQRARLRQEPATCEFDVAPTIVEAGAEGGAQAVSVTTLAGCTWSAASNVAWIGVSPGSGTGNGTVRLELAANTGAAREGTVSVAGHVVTVRQRSTSGALPGCTYSISPRGQTIAAGGGAGGPVTVTTQPGCSWTATSGVPWISITSGQGGSGPGSVTFTVEANTSTARTGNLAIAGETFVVTQSGVDACSYTVNPTAENVGAGGGVPRPIEVSTTANCAWTATSGVPWIAVRSGASGTGNGSVTYEVEANAGGARTGTLTVAGHAVTISQQAAACSYAINPSRQTVPAGGGPGEIQLTTGPACAWTAVANVPWITIANGSGTGPAKITYSVARNDGGDRRGIITIGGQVFTVDQERAPTSGPQCTFDVDPASHAIAALGGNAGSKVRAPGPCAWTARSNDPWITITSGASGSGGGAVGFSVAPNVAGERTGTLTIADRTVTVTQAAIIPCVYVIAPDNYRANDGGGEGPPVLVTTTPGCAWTAASNAPWIRVTSGPGGSGPGIVRFSVDPNDGRRRDGTLTIAGQEFRVRQDRD